MFLIIILLIIAGMAKAASDAIADEGVKKTEWRRKYDFSKPVGREWWYLGFYKPANAEKFPFSATILVFLTDRWHMSQFIMLRCFYVAIASAYMNNFWFIIVAAFLICPILVGFGFEMLYSGLRKCFRNKR